MGDHDIAQLDAVIVHSELVLKSVHKQSLPPPGSLFLACTSRSFPPSSSFVFSCQTNPLRES